MSEQSVIIKMYPREKHLGNGIWETAFGKWHLGNGIWETAFGKWHLGNGIWETRTHPENPVVYAYPVSVNVGHFFSLCPILSLRQTLSVLFTHIIPSAISHSKLLSPKLKVGLQSNGVRR